MSVWPAPAILLAGTALAAGSEPLVPGWLETSVEISYAGKMTFDLTQGNLEILDFGLHAPLSPPVTAIPGMEIHPAFDFKSTVLAFNDVPASLPVNFANLQSFHVFPSTLVLSAMALSTGCDPGWIWGAFFREKMATDFKDVQQDDFGLDIAGGIGYRFSQNLTIGAGGELLDAGGAFERFHPGLGLDWKIADGVRVRGCGALWETSFYPTDDWRIGFRSDSTGDVWNVVDGSGKSRFIDLVSHRIGVYTEHRISGNLWLELEGGSSFGNSIGLTRNDGSVLLKQTQDHAFYFQVGLAVVNW